MPTHLDLFSGIGGFAIAAQNAGFDTIGFSEVEPYACAVLAKHWPHIKNHGDVRNIRGVAADLVTGGFPCQPYSVAGKRKGAADDRALWPEMLRVIAEARPAWVLGENVAGIINMELDRVLSDLEALGYATWPLVVPACAVDARHRRDRVWIVAHANDMSCSRQRQHGRKVLSEKAAIRSGSGSYIKAVSNSHQTGWGEQCRPQSIPPELTALECGRRWLAEPELGRVAYGIPHRAHRLRGLGNAIVPQVAEVILREIARLSP